jgi:iron complex transport system permease protein
MIRPCRLRPEHFVWMLAAALFLLSLRIGSYPLSFADIARSVTDLFSAEEASMATRVFWNLRFARTITAAVVGAVLGLCGGVYQRIFRSPLASPDLTGVSSGASFGAALAIVLGAGSSLFRMGMAFLFGLLSLALVLLLVRASGAERMGSFILAGIIISSAADAGLMVLKTLADPEKQLAAIDFWTMGSLAAVSLSRVLLMIAVSAAAGVLLLILHRPVTMLSLGEEECRSMGLSPGRWRAILLSLATLAVSSCVCVTGTIGFIGLIAPHIARFLLHRRTKGYLSLSAAVGAALLLLADLAARSVGGGAELPVSIFTVAAGIPVLVILLCRRGRWSHD